MDSCVCTFNDFLMLSADNLCNQFGPRSGPMEKSYFLALMDRCAFTFNDFPTSSDLIHLLITHAISLDQDQDRRKTVNFETKPSRRQQKHERLPSRQSVKEGFGAHVIKCDLTTSSKMLWRDCTALQDRIRLIKYDEILFYSYRCFFILLILNLSFLSNTFLLLIDV